MDYTHLGRSGLSVSRLCLGTMNFGPETTEDDSHAIMDRALDVGINFFDTANVYGWKQGEGITEQIVGRWFAQGGGRREKTVIATKLYGSMSDWPNDTFLSARNIRRACDASLQRLQTDYIDLYQMHHVDRPTPWDEIWEAFEVLRAQGKVLYFGSSNHAGWHIAQAMEAARRRGAHRAGQRAVDLQPARARRRARGAAGLPATTASASSRGRRCTAGCSAASSARPSRASAGSTGRAKDALKENRKAIKEYEDLCDELGEQPGRRRPRLAAAPAGRHRADHRPAHHGAARRRRCARWRSGSTKDVLGPARRDLPRPRRPGPRGLRLVAPLRRPSRRRPRARAAPARPAPPGASSSGP